MKSYLKKNRIISAVFFLIWCYTVNSQSRNRNSDTQVVHQRGEKIKCFTVENESRLQKKHSNRFNTQEFENWLFPKLEAYKARRSTSQRSANNVVTIPVVVHVIHNGDPIGTNENISDAQIQSQITVLNQDFRRMAGTPGFNTNPVGADTEIQFCLAARDPDGLPTNGIIRHNLGSDDSWEVNQVDEIIKPQTQWNPNDYLNIWVVNRLAFIFNGVEFGEIFGYAQFPSASGLEGLEQGTGAAITDGVVIGYQYFGSILLNPDGNFSSINNKGRTTTHEVGHYFGLRHIWGDGDCSVDDYCSDTPTAAQSNVGCPTGVDSCPSLPGLDMVENYMDYTDDDCMNIFTQEQKLRMLTVLANSPRRLSLTTSTGCQPGQVYNIDGSLQIIDMNLENCATTFSPEVKLSNVGNSVITSAQIAYGVGNVTNLYNWNGTLSNGQNTSIILPSLSVSPGTYVFNVTIVSVNGTTDENSINNARTQDVAVNIFNTQAITITIVTDSFGEETTWTLKNSDNTTIASGGPYSGNTTITQTVQVEDNECYEFTISDSFGDGICCTEGEGSYTISTSQSQEMVSGGEFTTSESFVFGINQSLGIEDLVLSGIVIYPNPVGSSLTVQLKDSGMLPDNLIIYNALGQLVESRVVLSTDDLNVNTAAYSSGIYYLKIISGNLSKVLKFIKG